MSLKKSILLLLFVLLLGVPLWWYTLALPFGKTRDILHKAPIYLETVVNETYPDDLIITAANGKIAVNQPTPYCLIIDKQARNGILFDPEFNPDLFTIGSTINHPLCQAMLVVSDTTVIRPDTNQVGYTVERIQPNINFTVDKENVKDITTSTLPLLVQWSSTLYTIAPIILIPLVFILVLIINIWHAMLNKIIFSLMDNPVYANFSNSYALSLRLFTMIIVITGLLAMYNQQTVTDINISLPFFTTIVILIGSVLWVALHKDGNETYSQVNTKVKNMSASGQAYNSLPSQPVAAPDTSTDQNAKKGSTEYSFDPSIIAPPEISLADKDKK